MTKLRAIIEGFYAIAREAWRDLRQGRTYYIVPDKFPRVRHLDEDGVQRKMRPSEIKAYADAARLGGNCPSAWRGKDRR